jgi:hypothetical protein
MEKHKSVLREQTQQINFKSVLSKAKHFQKCFELPKHFQKCIQSVWPVCRTHFWRETISTLNTEKFSRNRRFQENMESCQNPFFGAPSVLPPHFFPIKWETLDWGGGKGGLY